jgi:hypothetical protein
MDEEKHGMGLDGQPTLPVDGRAAGVLSKAVPMLDLDAGGDVGVGDV